MGPAQGPAAVDPAQGPTPEELETSRSRRTYLLLAAAALLLILPLVGIVYLRMQDTTVSGKPGVNAMDTFQQRRDYQILKPDVIVTAPSMGESERSLTEIYKGGETAAQDGTSMGFITGGKEIESAAMRAKALEAEARAKADKDTEEPAKDLTQAQPTQLRPVDPLAQPKAAAPPQQSRTSRTLHRPKLGSTQSRLKPASWVSDKNKGGDAGAGTTAPGMPPGMDPAMLQKMMGGAGGAGGMDPAALQKMMGGAGGAGGMDPAAMQKLLQQQGQGDGQALPGGSGPPPEEEK